MFSTLLKNNSLFALCMHCCFLFCLHTICFAQEPHLTKEYKKDSTTNNTGQVVKPIKFDGRDGPYIINDTLYRVNSENKLLKSTTFKSDSMIVRTDNFDSNEFFVSLKSDYIIPETNYNLPEKMVVISDIEGKYDAFASFLYSNKIIDEHHNWMYGNGHLVLVGDFVDRGKNVTQVLWLIYKLDHQARSQNGVVHFILGNHEVLNFHGDYRYNRGKYIKVAQEISNIKDKKLATQYLYSKRSILGEWLASKNVIEKIGDYLFVHGGLSPEILDYKLGLEDINNLVRTQFSGLSYLNDKTINFLYSPKGPFWYRGLVSKRHDYPKIDSLQLEELLRYYDVEKIVIGHTSVKTISSTFNGKVIRTDVRHGYTKFSGKTKGLLIEKNIEYVIDDKAEKRELQNN